MEKNNSIQHAVLVSFETASCFGRGDVRVAATEPDLTQTLTNGDAVDDTEKEHLNVDAARSRLLIDAGFAVLDSMTPGAGAGSPHELSALFDASRCGTRFILSGLFPLDVRKMSEQAKLRSLLRMYTRLRSRSRRRRSGPLENQENGGARWERRLSRNCGRFNEKPGIVPPRKASVPMLQAMLRRAIQD